MPPRKGVGNAPGALEAAACTTLSFQNGLLVFTSALMRLVLLVAVKVSGRPFGELAVMGTNSDLPAGMLALGIGSITGAARSIEPIERPKGNKRNSAKNFMYRA